MLHSLVSASTIIRDLKASSICRKKQARIGQAKCPQFLRPKKVELIGRVRICSGKTISSQRGRAFPDGITFKDQKVTLSQGQLYYSGRKCLYIDTLWFAVGLMVWSLLQPCKVRHFCEIFIITQKQAGFWCAENLFFGHFFKMLSFQDHTRLWLETNFSWPQIS